MFKKILEIRTKQNKRGWTCEVIKTSQAAAKFLAFIEKV